MITGTSTPRLRQLTQNVEAIQPRQHHVEDHQVERLGGASLERALAVGRRLDAVAFAGKPIAQRRDQPGLVFDEQQSLHDDCAGSALCRAARTVSPASSAAIGSETMNSLPSPGTLLTVTRPPWASTMRWTRLRPRPAP